MIEKILQFSLAHRLLVVMITAVLAAYGLYSLSKLPIDAVPDITNNQVQINIEVPSLSPFEVEKQVTYPIETAMAGIPGLVYTRSISRNGFAQVTVIFEDDVDLYFARSQVNERLAGAKESLPESAEPSMGAISTGLGEIYMWTVEYENPESTYTTPEGRKLESAFEKAMYLRTVQDWIIRPQLKTVRGVAEVDAIGGYAQQYHVQPEPQKLAAMGLSFSDVVEALERNNNSTGGGGDQNHVDFAGFFSAEAIEAAVRQAQQQKQRRADNKKDRNASNSNSNSDRDEAEASNSCSDDEDGGGDNDSDGT